jgi:hypothetical protein
MIIFHDAVQRPQAGREKAVARLGIIARILGLMQPFVTSRIGQAQAEAVVAGDVLHRRPAHLNVKPIRPVLHSAGAVQAYGTVGKRGLDGFL